MMRQHWPRWLQAEFAGLTRRSALLLYVGAPLFSGLVLGWNQIHIGHNMTRLASIGYWTVLVFMVWVAAIIGTRVFHSVLRCWWRLPLWATALGGGGLGAMLFYWPIARYRHFGLEIAPDQLVRAVPPLPWPTVDYLPQLFMNTAPGLLYWVIVVYACDRLLGIPRYCDEEAPAADATPTTVQVSAPAPAEEMLRSRLPEPLRGEILALEAEDHYVRAHTAKGRALVHYRFRDAVNDMRNVDGLQVHRSYWVRRSAIRRLFTDRHSHFIQLSNDLKVPVSRSYLQSLREFRVSSADTAIESSRHEPPASRESAA